MSWIRRLPAGDALIDLRPASPADVLTCAVFDEVALELAEGPGSGPLRIWVLHDAAAQWARCGASLHDALWAWTQCGAHAPDGGTVSDVVVAGPVAAKCLGLVAGLQSLGLAVHPTRSGGGLPIETVHLDRQRYSALTTPALPLVRGEGPAFLGDLYARTPREGDPRLARIATAHLDGLID